MSLPQGKKVHSAQHCAEVYQPPTPKVEYILRMFKILIFNTKGRYFQTYVRYTPLQGKVIDFRILGSC